jgi:uncharacterized repeat protein (TIGR01451 family)
MRSLLIRIPLGIAAFALAVFALGGIASPAAHAQIEPPARFTGAISLFEAKPSGSGLAVRAYVGDVECGVGKISGAGYSVNVASALQKPGCGTAGAQVTFTIGDYWAFETGSWKSGSPQTVDLSGPVTTPVGLAGGFCNELTLQFANKTKVETVIDSIIPSDVVESIWYQDGDKWVGFYTDPARGPNSLKTVQRDETYYICVYETTTLLMPVVSLPAAPSSRTAATPAQPASTPAAAASSAPAVPPAQTSATPVMLPDLVLAGISGPSALSGASAAGSQITYAVTVRNDGPVSAGGVKFVVALPQGLPAGTIVTQPGLAGFVCTSQGAAPALMTVVCDGGTIAGNSAVTLNVTVTLSAPLRPGSTLAAEAIVNPHNTIAEGNTSNNQRAIVTVVT